VVQPGFHVGRSARGHRFRNVIDVELAVYLSRATQRPTGDLGAPVAAPDSENPAAACIQ
jgi:hypothetical protein